MSPSRLDARSAAPLLAELARVYRTRRFYRSSHPAFVEALGRACGVWREALTALDSVEVRLGGGAFRLPEGEPVTGDGIDELAQELCRRRVRRLRVTAPPEPPELLALVDVLTDGAREPREGELEAALERAGVRSLTTRGAAAAPAPERAALRLGRVEMVELEEGSDVDLMDSDAARADANAELVRLVKELEESDDVLDYKRTAMRVERCAGQLCRAKSPLDAYRAVLALARHAGDVKGRAPAVRSEARERLGGLLRRPALLDLVVERACGQGLDAVQGAQVLLAAGPVAVPALLERLDRSDGAQRDQTASLLVALGEHALPLIVSELGSEVPPLVRRAARLLGEIQSPEGAGHLVGFMTHSDPLVKKEVARALARIATPEALSAVIRALGSDPRTAEIAAAALGGSSSPLARRALLRVIETKGRYPHAVRRETIRSLGRNGDYACLEVLGGVLARRAWLRRKENRELRVAAAHAIGRIGGERARELLDAGARSGDGAVREACDQALRWLGPRSR